MLGGLEGGGELSTLAAGLGQLDLSKGHRKRPEASESVQKTFGNVRKESKDQKLEKKGSRGKGFELIRFLAH